VFTAQRQFDAAIREYREVVRLQPTAPGGFANLAAAYAADGQFERAIEAIDTALGLHAAEPVASELRRQRNVYVQRLK
jgi:Flp pilus assembly protein TadD